MLYFRWLILLNILAIVKAFPKEIPDKNSNLKNIIVHKQGKYFIDVEAPIDHVWVGCSRHAPKEANAGLEFYILGENVAYNFYYRRTYNVKMCREFETEYLKILKGAKTVRIVGTHYREEKGPAQAYSSRTPKKFTNVAKIYSSTFQRLQVGNKCKAYYLEDCDLPKNYWAGVIPEE